MRTSVATMTSSARSRAALLGALLSGCAPEPPRAAAPIAEAPPAVAAAPKPACTEARVDPGPWPRASGVARAVAGRGGPGHLAQPIGGAPVRLRFLGAHLFDLLDKVANEAGPGEEDRRRVICAALSAAAASGAPVVRIWGSLKRTGTRAEVERAADLIALVLDENARRARPLRFVITLLNHQGGYGAPDPDRSLDDQDPASAWSARRVYLEGAWRGRGAGQIEERIEALAARPGVASSPDVIGWELVNELDTHRAVAGGALRGPEADALRDGFLVPALDLLARRFTQPILAGDLRGAYDAYPDFARGLVRALSPEARARLVWTSHVYVPLGAPPDQIARATRKLDLDLAVAAEDGLPFLLGELGQLAPGRARFCGEGVRHDAAQLFAEVLDTRPAIDAALFWGEGHCGLPVPGTGRRITIGAGGDSADLAPGEAAVRAAVRALRASARFRAE